MLITQQRLDDSLSRSEYRLTLSRARQKRQKRLLLGGVAVLAGGLGLWVAARLAVRNPPPAPRLAVAWPARELGSAILPSDSVVLTRNGQALSVGVENAQAWRLSVRDGSASVQNDRASWTPGSARETLVLQVRPRLRGWRVLGTWLAPSYALRLQGVRASKTDDGRLILRAAKNAKPSDTKPLSALVSSRVRADAGVAWDERALPLLEAAANQVVPPQPLPPGSARWTLVRSFDSTNSAPDSATYAKLEDSMPPDGSNADTLGQLARAVGHAAPQVSLKCVGGSAQGDVVTLSVLRLAFDGAGTRDGWRKAPGQDVGQKWKWWDAPVSGAEKS